jgi:hypothetical protein
MAADTGDVSKHGRRAAPGTYRPTRGRSGMADFRCAERRPKAPEFLFSRIEGGLEE